MEIEELRDKQRMLLQNLRAIRNKSGSDAVILALVADSMGIVADTALTLGDLYHYKDADTPGNRKGDDPC